MTLMRLSTLELRGMPLILPVVASVILSVSAAAVQWVNHARAVILQGQTRCVAHIGDEQFASIQAAINVAKAGEIVTVSAGRCQENLDITRKQDLTLKGAGKDNTILFGTGDASTILIRESQRVLLDGLTIRNGLPGVQVISSSGLTIRENSIQKNLSQGIVLSGTSYEVTITASAISFNQLEGIVMGSSQVTIQGSQIASNGSSYAARTFVPLEVAGISLQGSAQAKVQSSQIFDNVGSGILVWGSAQAVISDSTISGHDIGIDVASSATISNSGISANGTGIRASGFDAQATISGSTIISGNVTGLLTNDSAQISLSDSEIIGNWDGIEMEGDSQATISNMRISDNQYHGITISDKAKLELHDSTIKDNEYKRPDVIAPEGPTTGITMRDMSEAVISNTEISANGFYGIDMRGAKLELRDSVIKDNHGSFRLYDIAAGIRVTGDSAQAIITTTTISNNGFYGIWVSRAQLELRNSVAKENPDDGLYMSTHSKAIVSNSLISNNRNNGVTVMQSDEITLLENSIQDNTACGILSSSDKAPQGSGNLMGGNGQGDLCGSLPSSLRSPLVMQTDKTELAVPQDYRTLQEAIDAIAPEGTISVAAGTYPGSLTILKDLTLQGASKEQTVIQGGLSLCCEAVEVKLEALTISNSSRSGILSRAPGMLKVTITNVQVSSNGEDGLSVMNSAQLNVSNSTVFGNRSDGLAAMDSATVEVKDAWISDNGGCGISLRDTALVTGSNNWVAYNGGEFCDFGPPDGFLRPDPPQPLLDAAEVCPQGCPFTDVGPAVWAVRPGGVVHVGAGTYRGGVVLIKDLTLEGASREETVLTDSAWDGILITNSAQVRLQAFQVSGNKEDGLVVEDSATVNLINSQVSGNGEDGLVVLGPATVNLSNTAVSRNLDDGLVVRYATVNLTNTTVSGNRGDGVVAVEAQVTLSNSTVSDNENGLLVGVSATVNLQNSQLSANRVNGLRVEDIENKGLAKVEVHSSTIEDNGTAPNCALANWICNGIEVRGLSKTTIIDSIIRSNTDWGVSAVLTRCGYTEEDVWTVGSQVEFQGNIVIADNNKSGNHKGNPGDHPWNRPEVPDGQVCLP